jgi:hypothetical protein
MLMSVRLGDLLREVNATSVQAAGVLSAMLQKENPGAAKNAKSEGSRPSHKGAKRKRPG